MSLRHSPSDLALLMGRIHRAQLLLERMCARIEEAAVPEAAEYACALWGMKDNASMALARLQQMQAKWAELELDVIRLGLGSATATRDEGLLDIDLDLLESELARLRAKASDAIPSGDEAPDVS